MKKEQLCGGILEFCNMSWNVTSLLEHGLFASGWLVLWLHISVDMHGLNDKGVLCHGECEAKDSHSFDTGSDICSISSNGISILSLAFEFISEPLSSSTGY